jgi:hypothetical protein
VVDAGTVTANSNGAERPDVATWLDDKGLTWRFVSDFDLSSIDRDKSLANQARLGDSVDAAVVEEYRDAIRRGDRFPAIVIAQAAPRSVAVTIDGNHRSEAARAAGLESFGAYVVKARPGTHQVVALTMEANTRHGRPTSTEERVQQALWLVDNLRTSVDKAAAVVNVSAGAVRSRWDKVKADRRADEVGLKRYDWDGLGATVRSKLLSVSTDEGFKAAARLAVTARLTNAEVDDLIRVVNESRSAVKQVAVVKRLRKDYAERIAAVASGLSGRGAASPRTRLRLALTNLLSLPDDFSESVTSAMTTPAERQTAAAQARAGAVKLASLADSLER